MALLVKKFGGTSVGTLERIQHVADKIIQARTQGDDIVVVLSAMNGETDRLIQLGTGIDHNPSSREYDVLLSTGETVSTALLAMALINKGCPAKSYSGRQAGIQTDSAHKKARIIDIDTSRIKTDLNSGRVPVVAGFQGVDSDDNTTTLGRGGSDTTAVALAASLKADECQIYTDVEGVYTTDPRVVTTAHRLDRITFEEMLELASLGTKVLQIRAVEFAGKYNVPVRVLSTFVDGPGTLISYEGSAMEQALISGIAFDRNQAKLSLTRLPNSANIASQILSAVSDANIDVDMIVQNEPNPDNTIDLSFTVTRDDYPQALTILQQVATSLGAGEVKGDDKIAKLSIVGVGMRSHAGVATKMFKALGEEGINIRLITTSEIKISVIIDEKYIELGARTLHDVFQLDKPPVEEK